MSSQHPPALSRPTSSSSASRSCRTLGLIGYGAFGRFIGPYLAESFMVVAYDPMGIPRSDDVVRVGTLIDAATCDIVVLAPPVQQLGTVIDAIAPLVRPGALVMDVASVKSRPVAAMRDRLPQTVDVVGLHPLFGPQSGRNGIRGLPIVVCPVRPADPSRVIDVLTTQFGLAVTVLTPDAHDRMMANVQALTHFVAAALKRVVVPAMLVETHSYAALRAVVELVGGDDPELYRAIQCENPYANEVRRMFVQATLDLARELGDAPTHPTRQS